MAVQPAQLSRPDAPAGSEPFVPTGSFEGDPTEYDYVEEEWFATGEVDGHPYTTTVYVRRPRDAARFSGVVVVEPVHAASAAPVWIYTSDYLMRSGHGWAAICSQKSVLDGFVKPHDADRYASTEIWADTPPLQTTGVGGAGVPSDPEERAARFAQMQKMNALSTPILAQIGAALAQGHGPFEGYDPRHVILAGHSQTGGVVTDYVQHGHDVFRFEDGSPVFHGFFPSGAPRERFGPRDVPLVQVLSDGDIASINGPWREGRGYRRDDSDDPGDRYRLYELAGVGHMGTRNAPYNDNAMWQNDPIGTAGNVPKDMAMNSLPHSELFAMGMDHLVRWVDQGVVPPRADRIEIGPDDLFVKDEYGNTKGGVRSAPMDVPRNRYQANPGVNDDGSPAFGVVGVEEPLPRKTLQRLYTDHQDYVDQFNRRVDELVAEGWLLAEDADAMRKEAEQAAVP
jgi:hypothetical protein